MNILDNIVNKFGMDKVAHFMTTIVIVLVVAIADANLFNRSALVATTIGVLTAITVGIIKEVIDFFIGKSFDLQDLKFDLLGCIAGFILALVLFAHIIIYCN